MKQTDCERVRQGRFRMNDTTIWQIDPAHTTIEFAVKHMMFTTVKGRFTGVSGTIYCADESDPTRAAGCSSATSSRFGSKSRR